MDLKLKPVLACLLTMALGPSADAQTDGVAFAEWSQIAQQNPVSPAQATPGDHAVDWIGASGQKIRLVVREPHPAPGAPTVTLGVVAAGSDARPAFDAAIARAQRIGASRLLIPPGRYVFNSVGAQGLGHWVLQNLHDLTIDGKGATLVFSQNITGIYIAGSQRVRLAGFDVEFAMPLASLGLVEARDGQNVVEIDPRFPVTSATKIGHVSEYNSVARDWVQGGQRLYFPTGSKTAPILQGGQVFASPDFRNLKPGSTVIAFHHFYGGPAIQVKDIDGQGDSEDIVLDGIGIHGGPGMGVVVTKMKRGFALLNSMITPKTDGPGLVSTEFDAVHTLETTGDILIAGNMISGQGDDAINLNSPIQYILNVGPDGKTVQIANFGRFYRVGDHLAFFDATGALSGRATVVAGPRPLGNGNVEIQLDTLLPQLAPRMPLRNIALIPRRFAVIGNSIGHCQCHGLLAQIPHGLVRDNRFDDTDFNAIRLITNIGQWKEGTGAFDIIVDHNSISNSGPDKTLAFPFGAISVYGVGSGAKVSESPMNADIAITGNTISHTAQACITVASARRVKVTGNACYGTNLQLPAIGAISVVGGAEAQVSSNVTP